MNRLKPKNAFIISCLFEETIYTPARIARFALVNGFIMANETEGIRLEFLRLRVALARLTNNHAFPDKGDGYVRLPGQSPCPGWHGWRWDSIRKKTRSRIPAIKWPHRSKPRKGAYIIVDGMELQRLNWEVWINEREK